MLKYIPYRISLNKVIIILNQASTDSTLNKRHFNRLQDKGSTGSSAVGFRLRNQIVSKWKSRDNSLYSSNQMANNSPKLEKLGTIIRQNFSAN